MIEMEQAGIADVSIVNRVLKTLCRENGVERDRRAVVQIATLLLGLWKDGVHEPEQLEIRARELWAEAMAVEPRAIDS